MTALVLGALAVASSLAALEPPPLEPLAPVSETFPADGAAVPANGRVVVFGAESLDILFERVLDDGTTSQLSVIDVIPTSAIEDAFIVDVSGEDLAPGDALTMTAVCDACDFTATWPVAAADDTPPVFDDGAASVTVEARRDMFGLTVGYELELTLPPARDDAGAVIAVARNDDEELASRGPFAGDESIRLDAQLFGAEPRTVCFDVDAVDAAGNATSFVGDVCADLAPDGGCAQAPRSTAGLGAAGLLALALSRARRRAR